MARVTKLRAKQTRAGEKYTGDNNSLATDGEVEARTLKHSANFHHNRNDYTKFNFTDGVLTEIETYDNSNLDNLLAKSTFEFTNGTLTNITKIIYNEDGTVYTELSKDLNYENFTINSIENTKVN